MPEEKINEHVNFELIDTEGNVANDVDGAPASFSTRKEAMAAMMPVGSYRICKVSILGEREFEEPKQVSKSKFISFAPKRKRKKKDKDGAGANDGGNVAA